MSEVLTAAGMIADALFINNMTDTFTAIQARRNYQDEVAHLRAWLDWMERRHQVLVSACEKLVVEVKAEQASDRRWIAELERQNADLKRQNTDLDARLKASDVQMRDFAKKLGYLRAYGLEHPDVGS